MRKALVNNYRFSCFLLMLLTAAACCLFAVGNGFAAWTNGQAADIVLGQPDFTSHAGPPSATLLAGPGGAAIDPTTGDLWVADYAGNRVLKWTAADKYVSGSAASVVLGQPDFTSILANRGGGGIAAADTMAIPLGLAIDSSGTLWVADMLNNRVLRFDDAASKTNGSPADGVLGQPDFTSNLPNNGGVDADTLSQPASVAIDGAGRLWVSDMLNSRVLRYDNAAFKPNGEAADGVLGQTDFTSFIPMPLSAASLSIPEGIAIEANGRLWVTDTTHHRILRFDNAAAKPNGGAADGVLGPANFTSLVASTTQSTFILPFGVTVDWAGGVYVADTNNQRVLYFQKAALKPNGAAADNVFGQADFTSTGANITATGLTLPWSVAFDDAAGRLWVPDLPAGRLVSYYNAELVLPASTSIPTLSEWGALLFSLVLAAMAVVLVRWRKCA